MTKLEALFSYLKPYCEENGILLTVIMQDDTLEFRLTKEILEMRYSISSTKMQDASPEYIYRMIVRGWERY